MENINPPGVFLEVMMQKNKYLIDFPAESVEYALSRLTNQLWKLIPMREHDENWRGQLNTVLIEIVGLNEIFISPSFLQLLSKLEGLNASETEFELYRKTVFESISLLQELKNGFRI